MLTSQQIHLNYIEDVCQVLKGIDMDCGDFPVITEDLQLAEVIVPVIGGFSAGKSTLLNAFLGKDVLPVGITPETELATELRFCSDEHLLAWRQDGTRERMDVAALADIKGRAEEYTHLQLFLDNEFLALQPAIVLVDMPGFGSSLANHNKALAHYIPRGAHFIVVTSAEDGSLTRSMVHQLLEIQSLGRSFEFVLSKTNLRSSDEVNSVAAAIEEQLRTSLGGHHKFFRIGRDCSERMHVIVDALDPDKILREAFAVRLKVETHATLDRIGASEAAFRRDNQQNADRRRELEWSHGAITRKRDAIIEDIRGTRTQRAVDHCIREITKELDQAEEDLVRAATSGNQVAFGQTMTELTRSVLTRVMQVEMQDIGKAVAAKISQGMQMSQVKVGTLSTGVDNELLATVERGLSAAGNTLGSWTQAVSLRNQNEIERRKQEGQWKEGDPIPRSTYQGLATILAVTTSFVNPLIELAIIFLPNILNFFREASARDAIRQRVTSEIIPNYVRELRLKLPLVISDQVESMIEEVTARFEAEIAEQRKLTELALRRSEGDGQDTASIIRSLSQASATIKRLASEALYEEVSV